MILCLCPNPSIDKYIWLESFRPGKVNRVLKEKSYPGGKGIHVALGLQELGEKVSVLGFWGNNNGHWIKNKCHDVGINCVGPDIPGWNRTCLTMRSEGIYNETEILGAGPCIGEKEYLDFLNTYEQLLNDSSYVVMSGSWPGSPDPFNYSVFLDMAKKRNKTTFVDCSGDLLQNAMDYSPDTIHISLQEGKELFGEKLTIEEITETLSGKCKQAVVTNGEKGLYMIVDHQQIYASVKIENVISAVGSGDSLLAGLVYASVNNYSVEDTARMAAACGAANCLREDLGMFYKKDVDEIFSKVKLSIN